MSTSKKNQKQNQQTPKQPQTGQNNQRRRKKPSRPQQFERKFRTIRHRIRRSVSEETAGGVVFRRQPAGIEIMMIQDAKGRWTIPKGHVEEGERLEETAEREVKEETGLKYLKVYNHLGKIDFRYRKQDKLILMTTHVFLIHAVKDTDSYSPEQSEGIKDVAWFPVAKALDLIEYDDIGKLFLIALKRIRDDNH